MKKLLALAVVWMVVGSASPAHPIVAITTEPIEWPIELGESSSTLQLPPPTADKPAPEEAKPRDLPQDWIQLWRAFVSELTQASR